MIKNKGVSKNLPAITLMILAALLSEVLPGSTHFRSLLVFPGEIFVWGGGALLIRYLVRSLHLGWLNMLFLALALSITVEFLIQQTSVAPMFLQIKGLTYGRALGVNYVYLLWALIYESVFLVFLPVYLTELIFPNQKEDFWIEKIAIIPVCLLFLLGSLISWFSWTQIARPTVYNLPSYHPSLVLVLIAITLISSLITIAIGPMRNKFILRSLPLSPFPSWLLATTGGLWAISLYGIVRLALGISPLFPSLVALIMGLLLSAEAIYFIPKWIVSSWWQTKHMFYLIFGTLLGSLIAGFIGFAGTVPIDLYFKISVDIVGVIFLMILGFRIRMQLQLVRRI
jgi:hypothetical protein